MIVVEICRTKSGAVRAGIILSDRNLSGQSDTIHGALRNLAFEIEQSRLENDPTIWKEQ